QGPDGWETDMDPASPDTNFIDHPYDNTNFYYLTVATRDLPVGGPPQRIDAGPTSRRSVLPGGGETPVATVAGRLHFEQDAEYWPDSAPLNSTLRWEKWFWQSSTQGQSFEDDRDVPDADITQPARFRLRAWGISDNHEVFSESSCPESVPDHLLDCAFNDVVFTRRVFNGKTSTQGAAQTYDTTGVILRRLGNHLDLSVPNFTFGCPSRRDQTGLAWYELYYERLLQ